MSKLVIPCERLCPGVIEGNLCLLSFSPREPRDDETMTACDAPASDTDRVDNGIQSVIADLQQEVSRLESESFSSEADIVRTHIVLLQDPKLQQQFNNEIERTECSAETAVEHVVEGMVRAFRTMQDPVLAERAADLRDLAAQLKAKLANERVDMLTELVALMPRPVLAVPELRPSLVLQARRLGVCAFVVESGTGFSHAAILAKAFGMPTVRVPSLNTLRNHHGQPVLVDGDAGELLIDPDGQHLKQQLTPTVLAAGKDQESPVHLWASIVDPVQLEGFDWTGVDGVGLYRTETLFLQQDDVPSEQEQIAVYRNLFRLCGDRPVTIRTLDLGGDKTVPYMLFGPERNVSLGLRAHRIYRFHPELLITQLRAILRAADGPHRLRIMYPMVESLDQWRFLQQLLRKAVRTLQADELSFQRRFEQGVLVEAPSAVLGFRRLLTRVDFASIGTNDLVQYLFAVDRNNANVASMYLPEHPIVLEVIRRLVRQAQAARKHLSICGEIGADPTLIPLLVGLGLEHLTVAVKRMPDIRLQVHSLQIADCRILAGHCLKATSIQRVHMWLGKQAAASARPTGHLAGQDQAVDPVCGMIVPTHDNPFHVERNGTRYHFCSRLCARRFMASATPSSGPTMSKP